MPRYKPQERHSLLLPAVLSEQIVPGSFAFALQYLVDHELDLSAMDAKFNNDESHAHLVGALGEPSQDSSRISTRRLWFCVHRLVLKAPWWRFEVRTAACG